MKSLLDRIRPTVGHQLDWVDFNPGDLYCHQDSSMLFKTIYVLRDRIICTSKGRSYHTPRNSTNMIYMGTDKITKEEIKTASILL